MLPDGSVRVSSSACEVTYEPGSSAGWDYAQAAMKRLSPVRKSKPDFWISYEDEDPATGRRTDH
jgi:hypothetical protein